MKSDTSIDASLQNEHAQSGYLNDLIAMQGVSKTATYQHLLGAGADLWESDADFEQFLESVKAVRHEKG